MLNAKKQLILAPMEGVMDHLMRELLTEINDFDLCITEFVRVIDNLLPEHVFYRMIPELLNKGRTPSGTPVRVQILGQDPVWMAENAHRAIELGSNGIDINFGCPAKTVNKSKGGAVLLKTPDLIYEIVHSVRNAIPSEQTLSVKIRLGFDDESLLTEIVDAIKQANANLLTVHARTKLQGYKPPAHWHYIANVVKQVAMPVIANGEIWSKQDAINCRRIANTPHLMLGRGILALPNLGNVIKHNDEVMPWSDLLTLLIKHSNDELNSEKRFYFSSRLKQWLRYLKRQYQEADYLFNEIKTLVHKEDILNILHNLRSA
jgi:tRNA-dihydrouridine synthase C